MILFLDFETTGLTNNSSDWMSQPGIVQVGAVKIVTASDFPDDPVYFNALNERGQEAGSFYTLVNPEINKWEDKAIETHGITPAMVADAPTFFEIGPALARFALGCEAWGGYNTKFDRDVLWHQLNKYGLERSFPWPLEEIDVMKLAGRAMELQGKRGTKNPKLTEAYQYFTDMLLSGAHDALADIRATVEVWRRVALTQGETHDQADR